MAYDQEGLIKLANEALTAAQLLAQESDIDSQNMSKTIERMRDIRANVTNPFSERNLRIVVKRAANLAIQDLAWEQQNGTYERMRDIRANVTNPFSERNLRIVVKRAANLAIQDLAWEQQNGTYEHLYTFQDIKTLLARIRNHLEHGIPLDAE